MTVGQTFLDYLIGYRDIFAAGVLKTRRKAINFGTGFTVTDNPVTGNTDVDSSGGGGGGGTAIPPYAQLIVDTVATPAGTRNGSYSSPYNLIGTAIGLANSISALIYSSNPAEVVSCSRANFAITGLCEANGGLFPQIASLTCTGLTGGSFAASITQMTVLGNLTATAGAGGTGLVSVKGSVVAGNLNVTVAGAQIGLVDSSVIGTCAFPSGSVIRSSVVGALSCAGAITLDGATCGTVTATSVVAKSSAFTFTVLTTSVVEAYGCKITLGGGSVLPTNTADWKIDESTRRRTWGLTSHVLQLAVTGDQTDYLLAASIFDFPATDVLELTCTGTVNLRSLMSVRHVGFQHRKVIRNSAASSGPLILNHQHASGGATLKFYNSTGTDITLNPGEEAVIDYSLPTTNVWFASKLGATGSADASGTFQTTTATTTTIVSYPLLADTAYRFYLEVWVRDTTSHTASWTTSVRFFRAGSGATQRGTDDAPAPDADAALSTALAGNWVTFAPSTNNVVFSAVTGDTTHLRFTWKLFVDPVSNIAAT